MVGVRRFHHHGQTNVLRRLPGFRRAVHHLAFGHRHAHRLQQGLGQILVTRNAFGDGAGQVALGRPDAALGLAIAQLNQVAVVQTNVGNAAIGRRAHDGCGAGAQVAVVDLGADLVDSRIDIKGADR